MSDQFASTVTKPCPFCGSYVTTTAWMVYDNSAAMVAIRCESCRARGPHAFDELKAVAAWNGRDADQHNRPANGQKDAP